MKEQIAPELQEFFHGISRTVNIEKCTLVNNLPKFTCREILHYCKCNECSYLNVGDCVIVSMGPTYPYSSYGKIVNYKKKSGGSERHHYYQIEYIYNSPLRTCIEWKFEENLAKVNHLDHNDIVYHIPYRDQ